MRTYQNRVAAITGAASGIGRALAKELAARGAHLALSDVQEDALAETAAQCERLGARVTTRILDVTDRKAFDAWAKSVADEFGDVHMIFNNAGIAIHGTFEEVPDEVFERVIDVDFWGVIHGTRAFLPYLKRASEGHIINISSVFGIIGVPGQSAYNSAKFAVRGFTECLRQELDLSHPHVRATCVHPGGIKTNIAAAASFVGQGFGKTEPDALARDFDKLARTTPEVAARVILSGVLEDRARILIGPDATVIDVIQRAMPGSYHSLVKKFFSRTFKGKKK
jgi:NAD(P)-dependent dehydrogenase (short-subunit alcohol dehydrogenase family)